MDPVESAESARRVAAMFDLVSETYDTVSVPWFSPIAATLVECVAPRPGERALDLGTGRGAALWPLAEGVAPGGSVTAVDISRQMIEATRRAVAERDLDSVELHVMDAGAPELPLGVYDVAVASLVLFFLPDPPAALRSWCRLLSPGGRLGLSTFAARDAEWEDLDDVFTGYLPPTLLDARTSGGRGPFASDDGVVGLLTGCGFVDVVTDCRDLRVHFTGVAQWRDWTWSHGQRSHWLAVPEERRGDVLADAAARLEPILDPDGGFTLTQCVRYTTARRPQGTAGPVRVE